MYGPQLCCPASGRLYLFGCFVFVVSVGCWCGTDMVRVSGLCPVVIVVAGLSWVVVCCRCTLWYCTFVICICEVCLIRHVSMRDSVPVVVPAVYE